MNNNFLSFKKIIPSSQDILHTLVMGERIDNIANKYYGDPLLREIIMLANPEYYNEFEIPVGAKIRIPMPLSRVFAAWKIEGEY